MTLHFAHKASIVTVGIAGLLTSSPGFAVAVAPDRVSTNVSPYAAQACRALDSPAPSRNYLNSEVEPQVAVDPTNPMHLVGAWQQDRWSDGGAHGLVAAYSTDGGGTWRVSPQPFSACYHAANNPGPYLDYQRASDPWVSIGPGTPRDPTSGSTVYSNSISFDQTAYPGDPNATHNAVGAASSYDGGATWSNVQTLIADPCISGTPTGPGFQCNNAKAALFNDKNSITADPIHPGVAYAVWDRLVSPPASPTGFQHERAFFGPTLLSKTTDFGVSWSTPRVIVGLSSLQQTIGNQIVVNRQTGALFNFFTLFQDASNAGGHRGGSVAFVTSTDGGATWSKPAVVAAEQSVGVSDPANLNPASNAAPAPSRTGDILPEPAINPLTGQLYVVWQDARFNGGRNDEVAISTSNDSGATWSPPELVNVHTGQPAYDPSVYVNTEGVVGVSYFQWDTPISGNEPTRLFIRHSTRPGTSASGPGFESAALVGDPFNNLAAPVARGYCLGDSQGLVATEKGFLPFYVKTNCADGGLNAAQPSCRAIQSVLNKTDRTPTNFNATDVYAAPGS